MRGRMSGKMTMGIRSVRLHRSESRTTDLTFDERDSAPFMPKCVVVDPNFDWQASRGARTAMGQHDHL